MGDEEGKMELVLEGTIGGRYERIALASRRLRAGRATHNDLHLPEPDVSRIHAMLNVEDESVVVEDLGSINGTFINETLVERGAVARPGDVIRFASLELRLLPADSPLAARFPLDELLVPIGELECIARITGVEVEAGRDAILRNNLEGSPLLRELFTQFAPSHDIDRATRESLDLIQSTRGIGATLIFLAEKDGYSLMAARPKAHDFPAFVLVDGHLLPQIVETRECVVVRTTSSSAIADGREHAVVAPLVEKGRTIGILYAEIDEPAIVSERSFIELFGFLAQVVGTRLLHSNRLHWEQQTRRDLEEEKERLDESIAAAARIQQKLLPDEIPDVPGYEIFADLWPSLETAGDFYDVCTLQDGSTMLAVGDVCGKGLGAALLMSNVISSLRMTYDTGMEIAKCAARLNRQLARFTDADKFTTLFLARLHPDQHRMEYVNAGHNPPFLIPPRGAVTPLVTTGLPVGMFADSEYTSGLAEIDPETTLCMYTDGIPEAAKGESFYGEEQLLDVIRRHEGDLESIVDSIMSSVHSFLGNRTPQDDITLLLLRRKLSRAK